MRSLGFCWVLMPVVVGCSTSDRPVSLQGERLCCANGSALEVRTGNCQIGELRVELGQCSQTFEDAGVFDAGFSPDDSGAPVDTGLDAEARDSGTILDASPRDASSATTDASVAAGVRLTPNRLAFTYVDVGTRSVLQTTLHNDSGSSATVSSTSLRLYTPEAPYALTTPLPIIVGAGRTVDLTIEFTPGMTGAFTADMLLGFDDRPGVLVLTLNGIGR